MQSVLNDMILYTYIGIAKPMLSLDREFLRRQPYKPTNNPSNATNPSEAPPNRVILFPKQKLMNNPNNSVDDPDKKHSFDNPNNPNNPNRGGVSLQSTDHQDNNPNSLYSPDNADNTEVTLSSRSVSLSNIAGLVEQGLQSHSVTKVTVCDLSGEEER